MIKKVSITFFLFCFCITGAQNWVPVSLQQIDKALETVLFDSVHNELLISDNQFNKIGNIVMRGVARWNGIKWDSLAGGINTHEKISDPNNPNGEIFDCTSYNGKLLVGGMFSSIGGVNASSLALWDGVKWDSLPKRAFRFYPASFNASIVKGFFRKNNLLYIYGIFDTIAGMPATGIATWDGTNFNPIILPVDPISYSHGWVYKMVEYKNEIYACGWFTNPNDATKNRILKYNGTSWVSVGGGIQGGMSETRDMIIYKNELYVCGNWPAAAGNVGNNIMKWDGNQWYDIGFGATFQVVRKMVVHNNKLWIFGGITQVAGMPASHAAVYDGVNWCTLDDVDIFPTEDAVLYKDTIFVCGGFKKASGDTNNKFLTKLINEHLTKQCTTVGIKENGIIKSEITVYPNPASNKLSFSLNQHKLESVEIINCLGQTVLLIAHASEIDVSGLASGYYNLKISTQNKKVFYSKFVKE